MKLYDFTTTEHNGEQEYSHYHLVYAVSEVEALTKARAYCRTWYEDGENCTNYDGTLDLDAWQFMGGDVVLYLDKLQECKQTVWKESRFLDALIGGMPEENRLSDIKKDLAKYLADYINYEKDGEGFCPEELCGIIEQGLDAFESTQEKVVTITEGGE